MTHEEAAVYVWETYEWCMREYENARADKGMMSKTKEAFDLAIAALREKQEREKGCGWCLSGKASADAEAEYCPMCGKNLERK